MQGRFPDETPPVDEAGPQVPPADTEQADLKQLEAPKPKRRRRKSQGDK